MNDVAYIDDDLPKSHSRYPEAYWIYLAKIEEKEEISDSDLAEFSDWQAHLREEQFHQHQQDLDDDYS